MEPLIGESADGRSRLQKALDRADRYLEDSMGQADKKRRGGDAVATDAAAGAAGPFLSPPTPSAVASSSATPSGTSSSAAVPGTELTASPGTAPERGSKRPAEENATIHNDAMEDDATPSASSSTGTGRKRAADVVVEDLADGTDVMMLNAGPAYTTNSDGSICEIYSPPRVVPHAVQAGFHQGWSLDFTTRDSTGQAWDFSQAACRAAARKMVIEQRPLLLIGSPMCTWFSILQELRGSRKQTAAWQEGYRKAVEHMKFVFELYDLQVQGGRYFLHEHPASATSWRLPEVVAFCAQHPQLYAVVGDMCQFGMTSTKPGGEEAPAKKPTRWLTNSACIVAALERKCPGEH